MRTAFRSDDNAAIALPFRELFWIAVWVRALKNHIVVVWARPEGDTEYRGHTTTLYTPPVTLFIPIHSALAE